MDYLYYISGILVFLAVVLAIEGAYMLWNAKKGPEAERVARRLRLMSAGAHGGTRGSSMIKQRLLSETPVMQRILLKLPRVSSVDRVLEQSGLSWSVSDLIVYSLVCAAVAAGTCLWLGLPILVVFAAAGFAIDLPLLCVRRAKTKRLNKIDSQLADALDLIGRALRAGHAFPTALKMVGDEMRDPIADEFRIVFDEVNFGISMAEALMNLATRVPSTDVRYFVIAVLIQRETGGNLAELLGNISNIIRERMKLLGQVRVLSAEGRMSAWVLGLLPFGAAMVIQIGNPNFLKVLYTDPAGQKMIMVALFMMACGVFVMRRIIKIRV